jgi:beta-lactam-binding protein with PASTA domain
VVDSSRYEPSIAPRAVISQDPAAGNGIKAGRTIYIKINRSSWENAVVPAVDFENDKVGNVAARLQSAGFVVGETIYEPHIGRDVVLGLMIGENEIEPGQKFPKRTVIDIKVGDGGESQDTLYVEEEEF